MAQWPYSLSGSAAASRKLAAARGGSRWVSKAIGMARLPYSLLKNYLGAVGGALIQRTDPMKSTAKGRLCAPVKPAPVVDSATH